MSDRALPAPSLFRGDCVSQKGMLRQWLAACPEWGGDANEGNGEYVSMTKAARHAFLSWCLYQDRRLLSAGLMREVAMLQEAIIAEGGSFDPRANVDPGCAFGKLYDFLLASNVPCPFKLHDNGQWVMWAPIAKTLVVLGYDPSLRKRRRAQWISTESNDPLSKIEKQKMKIGGKRVVVVNIVDLLVRIEDCCKNPLVRPAAQELKKGGFVKGIG